MTVNQNLKPSFRFPADIPEDAAHPTVRKAIKHLTNSSVDVNQAIEALNTKVNNLATVQTTTTTTTPASSSSSQLKSAFPGLGNVNDQTGVTAYTVQSSDNGILLIVNDSSPVVITLNPNIINPYFFFVVNFGTSNATLTPTTPALINGQTSLILLPNFVQTVQFDGTNWETSSPVNRHFAFGNNATINGDLPDIGPAVSVVNVYEEPTVDLNTSGQFSGVEVDVVINNPTNTTVNAQGLVAYCSTAAGNASNYKDLSGGYFGCQHLGSGTFSDDFIGMGTDVENQGGGTIFYMTAIDPYMDNFASCTATYMTAYKTSTHNEGTISNLTFLWAGFEFSNAGTITNLYGIKIEQLTQTGTTTNHYGLYIAPVGLGSTLNYQIYSAGTAPSYFAGPIKVPYTQAQTVYSVAGTPLPSAATAGMGARAFVSDATANTFGTAYTGSGTNKVPVYSDGTNWYIG